MTRLNSSILNKLNKHLTNLRSSKRSQISDIANFLMLNIPVTINYTVKLQQRRMSGRIYVSYHN